MPYSSCVGRGVALRDMPHVEVRLGGTFTLSVVVMGTRSPFFVPLSVFGSKRRRATSRSRVAAGASVCSSSPGCVVSGS